MLHENNLPKMFWAEAANTTVFLQNQLPTKLLEEKTSLKFYIITNFHKAFLKSLALYVLFMFHRWRRTSLIRRLCRVYLVVIVLFLKPTKYIILRLRRWLLPGMFISMKKNNGTRETHEEMSCFQIKSNLNYRMNHLMIHQLEAQHLLKTFNKGVM